MKLGVYAREVRVGDIVEEYEGRPLTVAEVRPNVGSIGYRRVEFWSDGGMRWTGAETQVLRLLHRPVPQVKESEALVVLETAITAVVGQYVTIKYPERLSLLHATLDAWELGKPPVETARQTPVVSSYEDGFTSPPKF